MNDSPAAGFDSDLVFYVNGRRVRLENPDPTLLLVDYLRSSGLTGTKLSCGEGGCGACTVMLARRNNGTVVRKAANACLRPVCSLDGVAVTTVEGIGSTRSALNPVQERLASFNGSQCGYCSPGFVMTAYSYLRDNELPSEEAIENLFGGHLCRCTGYRPILDAMRSFAHPPHTQGVAADVFPDELLDWPSRPLRFTGRGHTWYRATNLEMAARLKAEHFRGPNDPKLVAGNSSVGIYKSDEDDPQVLIDVSGVEELHSTGLLPDGSGISVGGGVTYTQLLEFVDELAASRRAGEMRGLTAVRKMLEEIAGTQVRDVATVGGAVALTWQHAAGWGDPFPSDLYPLLAALGARVTLASSGYPGGRRSFPALEVPPAEEWPQDSVVAAVEIPFSGSSDRIEAYRVARREQNSHALVNCCLKATLGPGGEIDSASLVYGGIAGLPVPAAHTEGFLAGRTIDQATVEGALATLRAELQGRILDFSDGIPVDYRLGLGESFLYRFLLLLAGEVAPGSIPAELASGAAELIRPLSTGVDDIPMENACTKLTAPLQTSGEQLYTTDLPAPAGTVYGALVLSVLGHADFTYPNGPEGVLSELQSHFPGILGYFTDADMPGGYDGIVGDDPVLVTGTATCYGQAVGLVVAEEEQVALQAAGYVQSKLIDWQALPAVIGIDAARSQPDGGKFANPTSWCSYVTEFVRPDSDQSWLADPTAVPPGADGVVTGRVDSGWQAHFYMEPQAVLAEPSGDGGITVHASTQSPDSVQGAVASILKVAKNWVQVRVRPLGGGFGGKTTRSPFVAGPIALAAWKLNLPVRLAINRNIDTAMIGKRHPFEGAYQAAYRNDGELVGINTDLSSDGGNSVDCSFFVIHVAQLHADNCYDVPTFRVGGSVYRTNEASNNAMRGYGILQTLLVQEDAIQQVAHQTGVRAEEIRQKLLYKTGDRTHYGEELKDCTIRENWDRLYRDADFAKRAAAVEEFNRKNRWKKMGICMVPLKYGAQYEVPSLNYGSALVSTFADGSVMVQCGGVENGQGLQTKVAQVAARALRIPLDYVRVAEVDTSVIANATSTGADAGSDLNGWATYIAARQLRKRLKHYWKSAPKAPGVTGDWGKDWPRIVASAYSDRIDLSAYAFYKTEGITPEHPYAFYSWSVSCSEVEVDVLTGQYTILRSDLLVDAGQPLNPLIDLGQAQGGFVQGLGYLFTEEVRFDSEGRLTTDGTWEYKPPCTHSIPVDLRVSLKVSDRPPTSLPIKATVAMLHAEGHAGGRPDVAVLAHQAVQALKEGSPVEESHPALLQNPALAAELAAAPLLDFTPLEADPELHWEVRDATAAALHSAKTIGEPPFVLALSAFLAVKQAVLAARLDAGVPGWFELDAPATVAKIRQACRTKSEQMRI